MDETLRPRELRNPRAMRALAHPLRLELLDLVTREGTLTATRAAELTGESAPSCSFHLRQLAKYGFIEDAGAKHGRERPWKVASVDSRWSGSGDDAASAGLLNLQLLQRDVALLERYLSEPRQVEPDWREAATMSTSLLFLTLDELRSIEAEVLALVHRYLVRTADPSRRPEGARAVRMLNVAFPLPSHDPDGR